MTVWMMTIPREGCSRNKLFQFMEDYDIHKWIIGREEGKSGYKHWQVRFSTSQFDRDEVNDKNELISGIERIKDWFKQAHIEKASDTWNYETKSGNYFRDDDNDLILRQRFGKLRDNQQKVLETVYGTNDRQIVTWVTEEGNVGKSWLCGALWERRIAHTVQPQNTAKGLIQDVASEVLSNGKRDIIIIDIPRTWKWTEELYCAIETIKDGLIKDTRYGSRTVNIRGTKLLVLCNAEPKLGKLSRDRWVILHGATALS